MTPYYADDTVTLHHGDCLDVLRSLPDCSVDSVVCDPPYGLGFMGRDWDRPGSAARGSKTNEALAVNPYSRSRAEYGGASYGGDQAAQMRVFQQWCEQWTAECLRVLKPGGHLLAFGGTRTWHRLACAVEDAGFEVRDSIAWLYGSGFPKSLDVSKAIDKAAGATREVVGTKTGRGARPRNDMRGGQYGSAPVELIDTSAVTAPATEEAARFAGWGTALKPAFEPVVVARKPLAGTVAANVLAHGTGALNVDACRVGTGGGCKRDTFRDLGERDVYDGGPGLRQATPAAPVAGLGRWPTNVVLDGHAAEELDRQSGTSQSRSGGTAPKRSGGIMGRHVDEQRPRHGHDDEGGASRFFPTFRYQAKAPTRERPKVGDTAHPTVKPLALMQWLVRLVTPPGGVVLDPFAGSGTTVEACLTQGFRCIAIEREADYLPLIEARIARQRKPDVPNASEALALFDFGGAA